MGHAEPLILSLRGATPSELIAAAIATHWLPDTAPDHLTAEPGNDPWPARFERTTVDAWASWGDRNDPQASVAHSRGCTILLSRSKRIGSEVLQQLEHLPFTLAELSSVHPEWSEPFPGYDAPSFSQMLPSHGWACAFRATGHERLVSRRWLKFGPWRLHERSNDLSIVEFHDPAADASTALAQAKPGHARMGVTDEGGYIGPRLIYKTPPRGFYDPATKQLKVVVAGRKLTQRELLEACALRIETRAVDPGPINNVAYVFMEEAEANQNLHELWLRGLECRALRQGVEVRLDEDYAPTPTPPTWA